MREISIHPGLLAIPVDYRFAIATAFNFEDVAVVATYSKSSGVGATAHTPLAAVRLSVLAVPATGVSVPSNAV